MSRASVPQVVVLAGGVGGAKFAYGLMKALPDHRALTVIVNVGDDFEHWGLKICPDLDTVCYTLAEMENPETGWGRRGESWRVLAEVERLGGPGWFRIGDLDLATHLQRTVRLRKGEPLSAVVADFCRAWGVAARVLPVTDDPVPTWVLTEKGALPFQTYFVQRGWQPRVRGFRFHRAAEARPAPGVLEAIRIANVVFVAPSNPFISIDPILAIPHVRSALGGKTVIAVSPIVGGQALKGPAAKMFRELGWEPSALAVAHHYRGLATHLVIDRRDAAQADAAAAALGGEVWVADTVMSTPARRVAFAADLLRRWRQAKGFSEA